MLAARSTLGMTYTATFDRASRRATRTGYIPKASMKQSVKQ
jgi:hypothetical protein